MRQITKTIAIALGLFCAVPPLSSQPVRVDPRLPEYKPVQGVSGSIKSVGSDTLNNLMTLWAEKFKELYPNVTVIGDGAVVIDRNIDVHVRAIRKKIGPYRDLVMTIRGVGYRFRDDE